MPICRNCNNRWHWKQTVKRMSQFNSEMICPFCGEKQYQSKASQALAPFSALIVLLPLLIQSFVDVNIPVIILLGSIPILIIIILIMYPFLMTLSSKKGV